MIKELICIVCPNGCHLTIDDNGGNITVTGNKCPRGKKFAEVEMTAPTRSVTSTVRTVYSQMPVVPVRTNGEISKDKIFELMRVINSLTADRLYRAGEVIYPNALNTGVDVIVTADMNKVITTDRK